MPDNGNGQSETFTEDRVKRSPIGIFLVHGFSLLRIQDGSLLEEAFVVLADGPANLESVHAFYTLENTLLNRGLIILIIGMSWQPDCECSY